MSAAAAPAPARRWLCPTALLAVSCEEAAEAAAAGGPAAFVCRLCGYLHLADDLPPRARKGNPQ